MSKENRVSDELAACPFCGGEAEIRVDAETDSFDLGCSTDGCAAILMWAGEDTQYLDDAVSAWNLRTLSLPAQEPVSFEGLPKRKLDDLVGRGWEVVGYALQNGEQRYGFITTGGFVGWWLPEDYPLHTSGEPPQPKAVITEEMVERAMKAYWAGDASDGTGKTSMRSALTAALKEA
ncbi:Lar family restriction alleviation protein [Devosia sp.]|uniref:Lar family restriction alleviation protein n=1 Tax=Devosia sp. TaxID=1871048 RepID=UPI001B116C6D|nr:Lar family restriction alleviation protein [Devosia sp.]MBO9589584.1 Lar family restriction alleviation protein [Devosia sp.]